MASKKNKRVDPRWPEVEQGGHAISEFNADKQGALSPFGELDFPLSSDQIPYIHPTTVINR